MEAAAGRGPGPSLWRRMVRLLLIGAFGGLLVVLLALWYVDHRLVGPLDRVDGVFDGLGHRPADTAADTFLLVINDAATRRSGGWLPHHGTAVSVQLVEVDPDRRHVHAFSLPLGARARGGTTATLGQVAASGHPARLVRSVEEVSGMRVDHLVVVDTSYIATRARQEHGLQLSDRYLSPEQVVDLFRRPATTQTRATAQQDVLAPLVAGTLHQEFRKHPWELWSALDLFVHRAGVESGWSSPSMAWTVASMRDLRSAQVAFEVAPTRCSHTQGCVLRRSDGRGW